ncbi:chymotrypsin B-like [Cloeon dipterum]|uniref:chymotrypsin B-like n=1 Tax=Cloeon dipterum TaxID=197152 RepID=UPI00322041C9
MEGKEFVFQYGAKRTSNYAVTAGVVDRTALSNGVTKYSTNKILHPTYDDFYLYNNIALIKLTSPFSLGANINFIRLPKQSDATNTFVDSDVTICGFGKKGNYAYPSTLLQTVGLTVTSQVECAATYGTTAITSSMMCTGAQPELSVCGGDFGGGLMYREADSQKTIIGIASFISRRSCLRYPAVYTRVTSFLGWISSNTGIAIRP